jgi:hypothetical protein
MDSFLINMVFSGFSKERKKNKEPVPTDMAEELAHDAYVSGGLKQMKLERVILSVLNG